MGDGRKLATKKIVPDYITTQIDHDTGQGNRDWLAVSLWSAVTRHRFLFRTRLSLERRSCWQTRFEKESSDKSEHSKDKNDRVNPISQLTAFSTASVRLNCAFACGCLTMMELRGVRVHNLQNLDIDLPTGKLISICGVSGSGKTSLALDTLYAEGQRRYIESFSAYTRQFLDRLEKPDADRIDGLPPAIGRARDVRRKPPLHGRHDHGVKRLHSPSTGARGSSSLLQLRPARSTRIPPVDQRMGSGVHSCGLPLDALL